MQESTGGTGQTAMIPGFLSTKLLMLMILTSPPEVGFHTLYPFKHVACSFNTGVGVCPADQPCISVHTVTITHDLCQKHIALL